MAIRPVLRMGHPILRIKARDLSEAEIRSKEVARLVRDMVETMHAESGIGLAAPQIGESLRIAVIELDGVSERYPEAEGDLQEGLGVYFNPKITALTNETQSFWEGCLSVPGLRGLVERPKKIRIDYLDEKAKPKTITVEGFLATVFQHEFDHLEGTLYIDRIKEMRNLAYLEEYQEFIASPSNEGPAELDD